jgi:hypothetical protein
MLRPMYLVQASLLVRSAVAKFDPCEGFNVEVYDSGCLGETKKAEQQHIK